MRLPGFSPQNLTTANKATPASGELATPLKGTRSQATSPDALQQGAGKNLQTSGSIAQLIPMLMEELLSALSGGSDTQQALPETAPDQMPFEEVVATLGRHEDLLKKATDREGMEKLLDDPKTPSDAKKALSAVLKDPEMFAALDGAKKNGKTDGKISAKDIQTMQQNPLIRQYTDAKSEDYTHAYMPSDSAPGSAPREMTSNDAMRELYLYSESLPKKVSLESLQKIADGSQDMGKCPPQVAAAAKFFTDNPEQWQQLTGKDDPSASVSKDRLCDLASYNVKLAPQEDKALKTIQDNEDIFFKGGGIKPDKLKDIANNEENSQEVRDAANLLSQPNSMLFSMLDNGKHGAGGDFFNKANDKNIGKGDIDAFIKKGSNQIAAPAQLAKPSLDPDAISAQQDMTTGKETQPDQKKEKGGGFYKMLEVFSYIASAAFSFIPGVGAAGLAATAGRVAATTAIKEGAKQAAKEGLKEGAQQGAEAAITGGKNGSEEQLTSPRVWAQS
ncbi:type III secretion translocon protein HrpF [Erwinia toletana]|uniref:Type III secretion translocon protein HrpF n=1 Tax=Winslowiella toletana TaxID=92490 RepID=A0ABS4PAY2_9GAMM|nr:HrpF/NolX family T3SS translocon protein [Winslowiella toletana]MBP2169270.1 type III secretion translocon protein HrpF [Winslowiella toletana]